MIGQRSPADFFRPGLGEKRRRPSPKFINSTRRTLDLLGQGELGTSPVKFLDRNQEKNTQVLVPHSTAKEQHCSLREQRRRAARVLSTVQRERRAGQHEQTACRLSCDLFSPGQTVSRATCASSSCPRPLRLILVHHLFEQFLASSAKQASPPTYLPLPPRLPAVSSPCPFDAFCPCPW